MRLDARRDTYEGDGFTWRLMASGGEPGRLVYDGARQRMIGLCGDPIAGPFSHREWDGHAWRTRAVQPAPAFAGPSAYDTARSCVVMLELPTRTLWEWDGSVWRQVSNPITGLTLVDPHVVFDSTRRVVLLLWQLPGPSPGPGYAMWSWDGATLGNLGVAPLARGFACADHPASAGVIAHGGGGVGGFAFTHRWEGTQWTPLAFGYDFIARNHALLTLTSGALIGFGGSA